MNRQIVTGNPGLQMVNTEIARAAARWPCLVDLLDDVYNYYGGPSQWQFFICER